ncbi:acetyl-CoA carboxylase biotin carboxyl carrier protein subunit [Candidatus Pelagibacter sp.]|nr:acetyl-CoA carboxylase biotin carboxyl carrier protein subunit [Candidatus Pelagibacter sp.]
MEIDKKVIKKLIDALEDLKKSLDKSGEKFENSNNELLIEKNENLNFKSVKSPIIGTAYLAPEPGAKPFVEIGKKIKKGDTVMIVEAMKTMNHVPSSLDGIVKKISVEDGQPVEYDQELILVE